MIKSLATLLTFALISVNASAFTDPKIGGMVTLKSGESSKISKGGVLFVYAKNANNDQGPPVAVFRYQNPIFPQAFVITQKQVMIPGTEFKGPFKVYAKYSPNGDALASEGVLQGSDPKFPTVQLGNKNLKIELE